MFLFYKKNNPACLYLKMCMPFSEFPDVAPKVKVLVGRTEPGGFVDDSSGASSKVYVLAAAWGCGLLIFFLVY